MDKKLATGKLKIDKKMFDDQKLLSMLQINETKLENLKQSDKKTDKDPKKDELDQQMEDDDDLNLTEENQIVIQNFFKKL